MSRVALITGASRGIGKAIAEKFLVERLEVLTPTHQELDLLSNDSMDHYLSSLRRPVDILVNNAGINRLGSAEEYLDSDLSDTLQINLIGSARLARGVIPGMIGQRFGRIVNISSIWSLVSKPRRLTYAISKSGLNGLTRILAVELAPYNILVNSVAPGYVNTELTKINNTPLDIDNIRKTIPMQRLAEPPEIAEVVYFLCSERNAYLTGQTITVDGGFTCL